MKLAIPVFQTKVAPRFDETQGFVLLETKGRDVVSRQDLVTSGWSQMEKMTQLVDLGVETVICGGIDRASLQYLDFNGVTVFSWVTGEVEDAVTCFLDNRMTPGIILGEHGKMTGRWQFCRGRNHLCNLFQTGVYHNQNGRKTMPNRDGTGPRREGRQSGTERGGCRAGKGGRGRGKGRGQGRGSGREARSPLPDTGEQKSNPLQKGRRKKGALSQSKVRSIVDSTAGRQTDN